MISPNNPKIPYSLYLRNDTVDSLINKKNSFITLSNSSMLKHTTSKENFNSNNKMKYASFHNSVKDMKKLQRTIPTLSTDESLIKLQDFQEFFRTPKIMFKIDIFRKSNVIENFKIEENQKKNVYKLSNPKKIQIKQLLPFLQTSFEKQNIVEIKPLVVEEIRATERKKTQPYRIKESIINYKRRSTTISEGDFRNHKNLQILKFISNQNKDKVTVIKPKFLNEQNKKIIEINKKKNFGFFKNSKKLINPSILISNKINNSSNN